MRRKIHRDDQSSYIPMVEEYRPTYLVEPVHAEEQSEYIKWLREGVVGHLDKVVWNIKTFTDEQRDKLVDIYRDAYPHAQVIDYTHQTYKWKYGRFQRQSRVSAYPFRLLINWRRDHSRQYFSPYDGGLEATWDRKDDYTEYHDYLRQVEEIMTICGLGGSLGYVELAQDTVSPDIGSKAFKHMVLSRGNHDQIMWADKRDRYVDSKGEVHDPMKAGTNIHADNHYQNNEDSVKQLSCHKKTKPEHYFDDILQSHIWRCELRIKRAVIEKYGTSVSDLIEKQENVCDDHIQWRQVNRKRLRGLRMNAKRRKELEDGFVIHAINQLVQRGIDNTEVRRSWVLPIDKMMCKYLR